MLWISTRQPVNIYALIMFTLTFIVVDNKPETATVTLDNKIVSSGSIWRPVFEICLRDLN